MYEAEQGADSLGLLEQGLDVGGEDMLAENVGDNDPDSGGDHGDGDTVQQPVHVPAGQVDHNVALEKRSLAGYRAFFKLSLTQTTGRLTRV